MNFDKIIQENLKKTLKLVRVKVDPIFSSYENFRNVNSYEGYIIEETPETVRIMIANPSLPVVSIPKVAIINDEMLEMFKNYILNEIDISEEEPLFAQIVNSTCLKDIEIFLKQSGYSDIDLIDIYRDYIEHV